MKVSYSKSYVEEAMETLGEAADYAIRICKKTVNDFFLYFAISKYGKDFANGNPRYISGMTGIGLVQRIYENDSSIQPFPTAYIEYGQEYWTGWIIAYYQWYLGRDFEIIFRKIKPMDIWNLYNLLHEVSEKRAVDIFNQIILENQKKSSLQIIRESQRISQSELSQKANISKRTLQEYENKRLDLKRASYSTVFKIAKALGCKMDDLIDIDTDPKSLT